MGKKIVYVGNNLKKKNPTSMVLLTSALNSEEFEVILTSSRRNKILRLLDMVFTTIRNRNCDYILIDVYSTQNFYYALIISLLAKFYGIKYIPILRGGDLPNRIENSTKFSNTIFKNAYTNVALSDYLFDTFKKNNYDVTFIPNIVDLSKYNYKVRNDLKPKLLWVRAIKSIYNPEMAIRVLFGLKDKYPEAKLCMVGPLESACYNACLELVGEYELKDSAEFTGLLTKEEWHRKSELFDIFINTTNIDNTPISVIEAMALGLPVISTNVGGIPYLIKDGFNGVLVNKNDSEKMIEAVDDILKTKGSKLSFNAKESIYQYDVKNVMKLWKRILK